ncbi:MAG: GH92 family glycosyl hydrolase, partial [Microlunatus sp.]|nr:GH92 family glycosyl hydrolase [Microlunatus sp.]
MIIDVGGPIGGATSKDGAGFTSRTAFGYRGTGTGSAPIEVDGLVGRTVGPGDRLRYAIYPQLDAELDYRASYAAVDLRFTDGSTLSGLGVRDQYGMPADAAGQGAAKILYADQWNDVQVELGVAAGRTVEQVLITVAPPESLRSLEYRGWVDVLELGPTPPEPDGTDRCAWVDTRRGSNASGGFSRGNNLPITAWPNGFNFLTPVTDASTHRWPYAYQHANNADNRPELQGIAFSHQPSPWMGDRDQLIVMPVAAAEPLGDPRERAAAFSHDDEVARPDRYRVDLAGNLRAEVAPTDHGAIFRFGFGPDAPGRHVIIDTIDENGSFCYADGALTGWVENGSPFGRTRMYCYGRFDQAPVDFGPARGGRPNARAATFGPEISEVVLRIATSFIGTDQARHNLELELGDHDLATIGRRANRAWNQRLSVITVAEATQPQLRTLYGSLYRLNLYPNSQFENAGTVDQPDHRYASPVLPTHGEPGADHTNAVINSGKLYVNNGFWDTYRTAWPAYAFLYPELAAELVDGFVQQFRDGGWVARWSSPGYADLMTGTSSDVAFADAYLKGVPLPDPLGCYDAGLRNATVTPGDPAVGRKGVADGIFRGYVSTDTEESVSWALEGYLNDFGLANQAAALAADPRTPDDRRGRLAEEAEYFRRRCRNYPLLFDPKIDFFQGRRADGDFARSPDEFDPCEWGGDFTETDGWNFAFHVPHDGAGLAALYGGPRGLEAKLDAFFGTPERADKKGSYGSVIHEMLEARAIRMGQFGFSNQPAHHIAYIYNYAGTPSKTQAIVREVLQRLFTGEQIGQGYPGDEDNGEMSAWYLFSALGLYPLRVGSPEYAIGSPLFAEARVTPLGAEPITITAAGNSPSQVYVQSAMIDNAPIGTPSITAAELAGGHLHFELGPEPSTWGTALPAPSVTGPGDHPVPLLDLCPAVDGSAAALFDDDSRTEAVLTEPISWSLPEPAEAAFYTLTSGTGADPSGWRLEGSTDGQDWFVLDERT